MISPAEFEFPLVLVIDDDESMATLLVDGLTDSFTLRFAHSGASALAIARDECPGLILLETRLGSGDGFELIRWLKSDESLRTIPVVFISSESDDSSRIKGLALGAVDYLIKPVNVEELKIRIRNHIAEHARVLELQSNIDEMRDRLLLYSSEVDNVYRMFYSSLLNMTLMRSTETGAHLQKAKRFMRVLVEEYVRRDGIPEGLTAHELQVAIEAAALHDLGKVAICDSILHKPSALTDEEFEVMKTHTVIGKSILFEAAAQSENQLEIGVVIHMVESHHERWDGTGYPEGLAGEQIPLLARMMAIVDTYDALVSERCYKPAITHEKAVETILEGSGTQFDPHLVDIFSAVSDKFRSILEEFGTR